MGFIGGVIHKTGYCIAEQKGSRGLDAPLKLWDEFKDFSMRV